MFLIMNINPSLWSVVVEMFSNEGYGHALIYGESVGDRHRSVPHFQDSHEPKQELIDKSIRTRKETFKKYRIMRIAFVLFCFILFGHSILFCQNIDSIQARWCMRGEKEGYDETRSCLYSIKNNTPSKLLIFFIEENNDSLTPVQLLRRKLLRRYGDFSLSMLEWESNMVIEDSCAIIPGLFVKCLLPKETFEIIMLFNASDREKTNVDITKHLLICEERVFSDSLIGMPNFVKNLSLYRVGYLYPYVVMNSSIFQAFINKQIK